MFLCALCARDLCVFYECVYAHPCVWACAHRDYEEKAGSQNQNKKERNMLIPKGFVGRNRSTYVNKLQTNKRIEKKKKKEKKFNKTNI